MKVALNPGRPPFKASAVAMAAAAIPPIATSAAEAPMPPPEMPNPFAGLLPRQPATAAKDSVMLLPELSGMDEFAGLVCDLGPSATDAANDDHDSPHLGIDRAGEVPISRIAIAPTETENVREKAELRGVVASRMLRARELSGLSQTDAAKKFGYSTPAQLSQWEQNRRMPPLLELIKGSKIYAVTVDYLLGLSSDDVQDKAEATRHACINAVRAQLDAVASITVDAVARHTQEIGPNTAAFEQLTATGERMLEAARTFCRLNHRIFDDMAGGASLVRCAEELEAELSESRVTIRQCAANQAKLMDIAAMQGKP